MATAAAALCGVSINPSASGDGRRSFRFGVASPLHRELLSVASSLRSRPRFRARCSLASSERGSRGGGDRTVEEELGPCSSSRCRTLLSAIMSALDSKGGPLYNSRVVLRELASVQAQRRGIRALEVLKKLVRRQLMYHSYSMQVRGEWFIYLGAWVPWELFLEALASTNRLASNSRSYFCIG